MVRYKLCKRERLKIKLFKSKPVLFLRYIISLQLAIRPRILAWPVNQIRTHLQRKQIQSIIFTNKSISKVLFFFSCYLSSSCHLIACLTFCYIASTLQFLHYWVFYLFFLFLLRYLCFYPFIFLKHPFNLKVMSGNEYNNIRWLDTFF